MSTSAFLMVHEVFHAVVAELLARAAGISGHCHTLTTNDDGSITAGVRWHASNDYIGRTLPWSPDAHAQVSLAGPAAAAVFRLQLLGLPMADVEPAALQALACREPTCSDSDRERFTGYTPSATLLRPVMQLASLLARRHAVRPWIIDTACARLVEMGGQAEITPGALLGFAMQRTDVLDMRAHIAGVDATLSFGQALLAEHSVNPPGLLARGELTHREQIAEVTA